ncbi:MAG: DNA polymerase [Ilumatobacteraceae bacterium]
MEQIVDATGLVAVLRTRGVGRGTPVAIALGHGVVGLSVAGGIPIICADIAALTVADADLRPRWVWWDQETAAALVAAGVRVTTCWDVAAVHRLVAGGWRADAARVWAWLHDLPSAGIPVPGQLDLLGGGGNDGSADDGPVRADGHLRAEWIAGGWRSVPSMAGAWAGVVGQAYDLQVGRLALVIAGGDPMSTARSESAAELLCAELAADGLPIDVPLAEQIIAGVIGPRPSDEREADQRRRERDDMVRAVAPAGGTIDLRSPADVKAMLQRAGIAVDDTRAWRLEGLRDAHPVVDALLRWRKAERMATTYGYGWLDQHVDADGRLRGAWTGCDGAAGRMTAQAGLHSLPADMRPAVRAEAGHLFVRADLGQIEPRVLAVVSGDPGLLQATADDDLYAPVAARLGVERPKAKIAVLAAMYGQTSGAAGEALRGMERAYPTAIRFLRDAEEAGRSGHDIRTYGGRLVRMWETRAETDVDADEQALRSARAGRGRFARNAVVQGAAAELFKAWAATVRVRCAPMGARIVLCLHDELLVHVPQEHATAVAEVMDTSLAEASWRWSAGSRARFVSDTGIVGSWADSKP